MIQSRELVVTVQHDKGAVDLKVTALRLSDDGRSFERIAIEQVMAAEKCPLRAITGVKTQGPVKEI
jgi:hypothetical protein